VFRRILVATDGSKASRHAVVRALALAKSLGAKMLAVHVTMRPAHLSIGALDLTALPPEVLTEIARRVEGELAWIKREAQEQAVPCEALAVESDHPWRGLIDTAKERGCDLIVMSSHGRHGLAGMLIGSETQKVLTHTTIPVLVMR
jgi:nucleotide-binding universal stress UspA family protein